MTHRPAPLVIRWWLRATGYGAITMPWRVAYYLSWPPDHGLVAHEEVHLAQNERLRVRNAKLEKVREAAEAWRADMALPVDHLRTARTGLYLITALDEVKA